MEKLRVARAYDGRGSDDGVRVLIDRLWPRGVTKEIASIDVWAKEITPSTELRRAYHDNEMDYDTFAMKYQQELENNADAPDFLLRLEEFLREGNVTLVTAVRDFSQSHVPTLKTYLGGHLKGMNSCK